MKVKTLLCYAGWTWKNRVYRKKKGVSKSTLEQLFNKQTQEDQGAIVLAPTYIRLSQKELETTFEQDKCFVQGYKKSIKVLGAKKK